MRITQADVAKVLALNQTTVSRALADHPAIPLKTRELVQARARAMGYRPDPALRGLCAHRELKRTQKNPGMNLGFIRFIPWPDDENERTEFEIIRSDAEALGYSIQEYLVYKYPSMKRLDTVLKSRGVAGLLLDRVDREVALEGLDISAYSIVTTYIGFQKLPFLTVKENVYENSWNCWDALVKRGYKRIGFIRLHDYHTIHDRQQETVAAYWRTYHAPESRRIPTLYCPIQSAEDYLRLQSWITEYRIQAVIGLNDIYYWALLHLGYRMPETMAYASVLQNEPTASATIAGSWVPHRVIYNQAITALDSLIRKNRCGTDAHAPIIMASPEWNEGTTLPRITTKVTLGA
ncbi:MAG: hypothetical protein SFY80_00485 [Verrucomicrobiota bacterium]|nr:hypothetical protein [Verrucomicrobiota bacterium]